MKKLLLITSLILASCGGGGGGDEDYIGAAKLSLDISPNVIDTGDRAAVTVKVSETDENGIILKLRVPAGMQYVADSSTLERDGGEFDLTPLFNEPGEGGNFIVYFIENTAFGSDNKGDIKFLLEAISNFGEGLVEVDADVNDPLIEDNIEFDPEEPEFLAEDVAEIEVRG
jgi:hypothetical protein